MVGGGRTKRTGLAGCSPARSDNSGETRGEAAALAQRRRVAALARKRRCRDGAVSREKRGAGAAALPEERQTTGRRLHGLGDAAGNRADPAGVEAEGRGEGEVRDDEHGRLLAGLGVDDKAPDSAGVKSAGSTGKHKCPWPGLELLCEEKHEEAMAFREKGRKRKGAGRKEAVRGGGRRRRGSPELRVTRRRSARAPLLLGVERRASPERSL